jgi:hypothetical protein
MRPFWEFLLRRKPSDPGVPGPPQPDGYPNGFPRVVIRPEWERVKLFDPSLQHYPHAFRLSDPAFPDPALKELWEAGRMQVIEHLLRIAADSRWREHLVLRGSLLLKAWLGDAARNPGDIDWVVIPQEISLPDPLTRELFEELIRMVSEQPRVGSIAIECGKVAVDDIWTYERAPGRRLTFPWQGEGLPPGTVQMDFVFGEKLWSPPVSTPIPRADGGMTSVLAATPELALAWKLLWLETDMYPQGKDLYDATLLAERTSLSHELLHEVLWEGGTGARELQPGFPMEWEVDWETFQNEYPAVGGQAREWQARLTAALAPTFANREEA